MKPRYLLPLLCLLALLPAAASAQGIHFSQYYNAPLLLNPANTALMPDNDYRLGASFRSQWASLPVPYSTTSAYGDFQTLRNRNQTNWLGLGFAFFNDRAGDGKLALFRSEALMAYHIQVGSYNMISAGASFSYGQRSVNFSKMSYPVQWDGFTFDKSNPNMENKGLEKSSYSSFAAGLNYALFPNELLYIKLGVGVANLNQPTETFWSGGENKLDIRPSANLDILMKTNENVIINPSAYFSTQSGAREIMYGTLLLFNMAKPDEQIAANQLIFGAFHRWGDAVVGVAGIQRNGIRIMASYDYTISSLPVYAGPGTGALELSIRYEGLYGENSKARPNYHCPRF